MGNAHVRVRRGRRTALLLAFTSVFALAAGCGSGDDASSDTEAPAMDGGEGGQPEYAQDSDRADDVGTSAGEAATEEADAGPSVAAVSAQAGRRIVRTATLELEVEDGTTAADEVAAIADRRGGFVAETDLARDADGLVSGTITLRVPSAELLATVEELDELAVAVPVRRIDEQDVTAESTDLRATLTNLETYEAELRTLLADVRETTTRPDDLLTVFERIRGVRAEIDRAEARLAVLDDQVSLSTVHVRLWPSATAVPVLDPGWAPSETVRDALTVTARGLSTIADFAIRFALTVVPIGLLLTLPALVAVVLWRRNRARHDLSPTQSTPAAP